MSHYLPDYDVPDHNDQVLLERDTLVGGIRVRADKLEAFGELLDEQLDELVRRWQPLAAPRATLAESRISSWR